MNQRDQWRCIGVILALSFAFAVMMAVKTARKHRVRHVPEVFCVDPRQTEHPLWGWEAWDVSLCELKLRSATSDTKPRIYDRFTRRFLSPPQPTQG